MSFGDLNFSAWALIVRAWSFNLKFYSSGFLGLGLLSQSTWEYSVLVWSFHLSFGVWVCKLGLTLFWVGPLT